MKKLSLIITICALLSIIHLRAQELINVQEFDPSVHYNDITPPSPTVAALNKFIETPVNYYTGVPQISIPIWQIKNKDLTHNISIDYHAGGIKVNEIASWVGLGWSLKAGGTISRSVRGLPDDLSSKGYLTLGHNLDEIDLKQNSNNVSDGYFNLCWQAAKGKYDLEPDIFYFSVGDISGSFVIDSHDGINISEKNIHITPWQNIIIKPVVSEISNYIQITGFILTDENGTVYTFGLTEESRERTVTSSTSDWTPAGGNSFYSAWHLNNIKSKKTNAIIEFQYKPVTETSDNAFSISEYNRIEELECTETVIDNASGAVGLTCNTYPKVYTSTSYTEQRTITSKLVAIDFDLGRINIESQDESREDLKPYLSSMVGSVLKSIEVKDLKNSLIKKYLLEQTYFNEELSAQSFLFKRLRLDAIKEVGIDEETLKYTFSYSSKKLPSRDSYATDHWGFYTNPSKAWAKFPEVYYAGDYYNGSDKTPDINYGKAGVLESIQFPTGGITKYEYEQNTYRYNGDFPLGLDEEELEFNWDMLHPEGNEPTDFVTQNRILLIDKEQYIYTSFQRDNSSFTASISDGQGGVWNLDDRQKFRLLPGEYNVTFNASHICEDNCGPLAGTSANIFIRYTKESQDSIKYKKCGGLRIKSIKSFNPENDIPEKTQLFDYSQSWKSEHGFSSGVLVGGEPVYYYTKTVRHAACGNRVENADFIYLVRSQNCINSFNLTQGSCVGYREVAVRNIDGTHENSNGTIQYFYTSDDLAKTYTHPAANQVSDDWKIGNLRRKVIKDENDNFKLIENYYYNIVRSQDLSDERFATGYKLVFGFFDSWDCEGNLMLYHRFMFDKYSYHSGHLYLDSITKEIYEGSEPILIKEFFDYDSTTFLTKKHINKTSNEQIITTYTYPFDYINEGEAISNYDDPLYKLYEMNSFHMDNNPVEVITEKEVGGVYKVIGANLIHYKNYHPYKIFGLNNGVGKTDFTPSDNLDGNFVFDEDNYELNATITRQYLRNPSVIEKRDGSVTSYIWGYKDNLPVAKIDNYDIIKNPVLEASVINNILESTDPAFINEQIQSLRNNTGLDTAMITSFEHKPLVGMEKQTDPNGLSTTYQYDNMQRLEMIKDNESNILKVYKYNYAFPTVSGLPDEINFDFNGGTKVIKLEPGEYSIGTIPNWLDYANTNYDPTTGNLTISCGENQTTSINIGTFELINNGKNEIANVSQNALPFVLSKTDVDIPFEKHMDAILVNIAAGVSLSLKNLPEWLSNARTVFTTYSQMEQMLYVGWEEEQSDFQKELEQFYDPTADPNQVVLLVWASDNPNFTERLGEFIVAGNGLEETVSITQDAKVLSFNVTHNLDVFEYTLIPQTISVESNAGITINGPDWVRLRVQDPNGSGDLPTDDSFLDDLTNTIYVPEGDYVIEIFCLEDNSTIGIKNGNIEVIPGIETEKVDIPIQQQCIPVDFDLSNTDNISLSYHSVNNENFGKTLTYNIPWSLQIDYQGTETGWITSSINGVSSVSSTSSSGLNLTINNNTGDANRTAVISLVPSMEGVSGYSYSVTQSFAYLNLVTTWLPQFSVNGGQAVILFDTNIPDAELSFTTPSWLSSSIMLGSIANGIVGLTVPDEYLNKPVVVVTANESNSPTNQTGSVGISGAGKSVSLNVTQSGNPVTLSISGSNLTTFSSSGSVVQTINVSSNYDNYTVETNQSWLKIAESKFSPGQNGTSGTFRNSMTGLSGSNAIDVKCDAKTTIGSRTGEITITSMGVSKSLTITQNGVPPYLNLPTSSLSYNCNGGSNNISVSSNASWSVSDNASWITTSKSGNTIIISVSSSGVWNSARTGKVTVSGGGITRYVDITQSGLTNPGTIYGSSLACAGTSNTYSISSINCATSYTWEVPSGWSIASGQGTNTVNIIPSGTSGTIRVKGNSSSGSSAYSSKSISIATSAPNTPTSVSGPTSVQSNTTYTYTVGAVSGATSYTWIIPSGATIISGQGTSTLKVSYSSATPMNTSLRVKANNCIGSSFPYFIFITVTDSPIN